MVNRSDAESSLVAPLGSASTCIAPNYAFVWFLATELVKLLVRDPVEPSQKTAGDRGPGHEPDVVPTRVSQAAA